MSDHESIVVHRVTRGVLPKKSVLLMLLLMVLPLANRAQSPEGDLAGTVQDSSGARMPTAKILVRAVEFSFEREATTDDRGEFRLNYLRPGAYQVSVSAPGFAEARSDVRIVVSTVREIAVTLRPVGVPQTVVVPGHVSSISTQPVDTTGAVLGGAVSTRDLANFPLAHRSFANIAYLVPGTEPVEPSDPTKARITAVSFGGSSGLNVQLSVDGGDNSDDYIGGFLQSFSPDAIQEFAVQTSQQNADTGHTAGGAVVITTRSGTNQWHGVRPSTNGRQRSTRATRLRIRRPSPSSLFQGRTTLVPSAAR